MASREKGLVVTLAGHPANPWLAIDGRTPPAVLARELRREWEQFLSGGRVEAVREPVADSWQRSLAAGVDPSAERHAPSAVDRADAAERWNVHALAEAAPLIRACLGAIADESEHLVVASDAAGVLLQLTGDATVRSRAADSMNFTEGALWSENGVGTNAIGTALAADHAVQIFATEHFNELVQAWTCSAAPVHDPETGELIGVIDLTGLQRNVNPHSLAVVMTTARAVEGHLRWRLQERDAKLRSRYEQRIGHGRERGALVSAGGRLMADDPRGWLRGTRVELPPGGGDLTLPSGEHAIAEPVDDARAFVVREVRSPRLLRRSPSDELRLLADEQAALRRLATAAARNVAPDEIFAAVAAEIRPLLAADDAGLVRFESDGTATIVAGVGQWTRELPIGTRLALEDSMTTKTVLRTGRTARVDDPDYRPASGPVTEYLIRAKNRSAAAAPIVVDGLLWGALVASTKREPLPADTEGRMANFTELVATVIANAKHRAELVSSRARVVAAADEARRRIRRDLHDGAQQRLVSTVLTLKMARRELEDAGAPGVELLDEALAQAEGANAELRELAHGILPAALSRGGLREAVCGLVSRVGLDVSLEIIAERLPPALEANAYFIVAEALTNVVKHARATSVRIVAAIDRGSLRLEVYDDGVGGARPEGSSGLIGLQDRVAALAGRLEIVSPPGRGTLVAATLPLEPRQPDA